MKMWSTREILSQYTKGIQEVECFQHINSPTRFICFGDRKWGKLGKDFHETRTEAITYANKALNLRIASLRKQLERLESLTFE